ncbi:MAG TPA: hypothetical protein VLV50_13155 [Stellaceae bacterium]|nr:hypothetical protein [Stellaceae bacterium]
MANDDLHRPRDRVLILLLLGLSGCGAFEGPPVGEEQHTICYSRLATSPDQLHTLAKNACSGAEPRFEKQSTDVSACPLLVPERLYFSCAE